MEEVVEDPDKDKDPYKGLSEEDKQMMLKADENEKGVLEKEE